MIPRSAIEKMQAILGPVEQLAQPGPCLRIMLQQAHDEAGQIVKALGANVASKFPISSQSPQLKYQI